MRVLVPLVARSSPPRGRLFGALLAACALSACAVGVVPDEGGLAERRPGYRPLPDAGEFDDAPVDPDLDAQDLDASTEPDASLPPPMDAPPPPPMDAGCATNPARVCAPGQTQACGTRCGTRTCTSACTWGACTGEGVCSPGARQAGACDACAEQVCTARCAWGSCQLRAGNACEYRGGMNDRSCGTCRCGRQWCLSSCQWSTACTSCCTTCGGCLTP